MGTLGVREPRLVRDGAMQMAHWLIAADRADAVALQRMLGLDQPATLVDSGDGAHRALLTRAGWRGLVIDVSLCGEAWIDVLALARRLDPSVPAVVMVTRFDRTTINHAFALGAGVMCKPIDAKAVAAFSRSRSCAAR